MGILRLRTVTGGRGGGVNFVHPRRQDRMDQGGSSTGKTGRECFYTQEVLKKKRENLKL